MLCGSVSCGVTATHSPPTLELQDPLGTLLGLAHTSLARRQRAEGKDGEMNKTFLKGENDGEKSASVIGLPDFLQTGTLPLLFLILESPQQ